MSMTRIQAAENEIENQRAEIMRLRQALQDVAASEPIPTPIKGWEFCRDTAKAALNP